MHKLKIIIFKHNNKDQASSIIVDSDKINTKIIRKLVRKSARF
jgi:hypothetical protein